MAQAGASLIAPGVVLTAAHKVAEFEWVLHLYIFIEIHSLFNHDIHLQRYSWRPCGSMWWVGYSDHRRAFGSSGLQFKKRVWVLHAYSHDANVEFMLNPGPHGEPHREPRGVQPSEPRQHDRSSLCWERFWARRPYWHHLPACLQGAVLEQLHNINLILSSNNILVPRRTLSWARAVM